MPENENRAMACIHESNFMIFVSKFPDHITLNEREEQQLRVTRDSFFLTVRYRRSWINRPLRVMKSPLAAFCPLSPRRVLMKRRENSNFTLSTIPVSTAEKEDEMTIFFLS